jgi:ABC-type sugar transport system permease subunit
MAKTKELTDKQIIKILQQGQNQNKQAYAFLLPWLIGFVIFTIIPFFYTIGLSFYDVSQDGLGYTFEFVNIGNYMTALFDNEFFVSALINFVFIELTYVPTVLILSFILATLLNRNIKFRVGFRTIFFLPVIVLSGTVMDKFVNVGANELSDFRTNIIFQMLFNYSELAANIMLQLFNNFTMVLWFTGIPIILFINGLQKINKSLFEAAKIDGATGWQILWKITIPIIKPTALIATIFTIVQLGLYDIDPLFGLANDSVFSMIRDQMYNTAGGLGLASAFTLLYTLVVLVFVGAALFLLGDRNNKSDIKLTSIQRESYKKMLQRSNVITEVEDDE